MQRLVALMLFVVGAAGWGHAQEMPPDVKKFLDNYTKDSTARFGPLHTKGRYFADSIQIEDLRLRAVEVYTIKQNISIDAYPDTVAFSEIIRPSGFWRVLVTAHDKPLYELLMIVETTWPRFVQGSIPVPLYSNLRDPMWEPLLEAYPVSTGINPVYVITDIFFLGGRGDYFLYFKQKGPRKIYYIRQGFRNDQLEELFPASISIKTLDDSKKLIRYLKEHGISKNNRLNANERMWQESAKKGTDTNENIEPRSGKTGYFIQSDTTQRMNKNIRRRN
jgi:hypothetical protein